MSQVRQAVVSTSMDWFRWFLVNSISTLSKNYMHIQLALSLHFTYFYLHLKITAMEMMWHQWLEAAPDWTWRLEKHITKCHWRRCWSMEKWLIPACVKVKVGTCEASNSNQTSRFDSKVTGRFENWRRCWSMEKWLIPACVKVKVGTCEASNSNRTSRFDSKVTGRFENFESLRLAIVP